MFVLVPSSSLQAEQQQQQQCQADGTDSDGSAMATAIPWRLRQVLSVEVAPGGDPADATVVLEGGDKVRAGAVYEAQLAEIQNHEVWSTNKP
jgi:hypothetical protein